MGSPAMLYPGNNTDPGEPLSLQQMAAQALSQGPAELCLDPALFCGPYGTTTDAGFLGKNEYTGHRLYQPADLDTIGGLEGDPDYSFPNTVVQQEKWTQGTPEDLFFRDPPALCEGGTSSGGYHLITGAPQIATGLGDSSRFSIHPSLAPENQWHESEQLEAADSSPGYCKPWEQVPLNTPFSSDSILDMGYGGTKRKQESLDCFEGPEMSPEAKRTLHQSSDTLQQSSPSSAVKSNCSTAQVAPSPSSVLPTPKKGPFSVDERRILHSYLDTYILDHSIEKKDLFTWLQDWGRNEEKKRLWEAVKALLPDRDGGSVVKHIKRTYHTLGKRKAWSEDEDERLRQLVVLRDKGKPSWEAIGVQMGRMSEDCRDRWRNYAICSGTRVSNAWSKEEIELLKATVEAYLASGKNVKSDGSQLGTTRKVINGKVATVGENPVINFTHISELMGSTRSRQQCRFKWRKLVEKTASKELNPLPSHTKKDNMSNSDVILMLEKVKGCGAKSVRYIPWGEIAGENHNPARRATDLRLCFQDVRKSLGIRNGPLEKTVDLMLICLRKLPSGEKRPRYEQKSTRDPDNDYKDSSEPSHSHTQAKASNSKDSIPQTDSSMGIYSPLLEQDLPLASTEDHGLSTSGCWLDEYSINYIFGDAGVGTRGDEWAL